MTDPTTDPDPAHASDTQGPLAVSDLMEALSGRMAGWPLAPVLLWALNESRSIAEPRSLVDELARRLSASGAPVWRLRIGMRMIHPQFLGLGVIWQRGHGRAEETRVGHGILETDAYHGSPIQQFQDSGRMYRHRLDNLDPQRDHPVLFELAAQGARDYIIQPMTFSDGCRHIFVVATDRAEGFTDLDIRKFGLLAEILAPRFEAIASRRLAITLMDTYLGRRTGRKVLNGLIKRGDGEAIDAALWYSDLRDFTTLTSALPAERLFEMLNAYFEFVSSAVTARGGEILSFIGDAMLIIFPCRDDNEREACQAALESAIDAFDSLATVNFSRRRANQPEIRFGLGLDVGKVIYGNVGAPDRLDFTVIGPSVNRTARLEALTKSVGRPILMSDDFAGRIDHPVTFVGHFPLKGIEKPQKVYSLEFDP